MLSEIKKFSLLGRKKVSVHQEKKEKKKINKNFFNLLQEESKINHLDAIDVHSGNDVHALISKLNSLGDSLKNSPSLKSYWKYKLVIEKIFKSIIFKSFNLKKVITLDKKNFKQKELYIVQVVNQELNSLLQLISQEQKNNFLITAKVIKIKGIIIDFLS